MSVHFIQDPTDIIPASDESSEGEQNVSMWQDEKELQHERRVALNRAMTDWTGGCFKPIHSSLNTAFSDISERQRNYYVGKAKEIVKEISSVLSPGQEQQLWEKLKESFVIEGTCESNSAVQILYPVVRNLVSAYEHATSWQTKRQILSLFANDYSKRQLTSMING